MSRLAPGDRLGKPFSAKAPASASRRKALFRTWKFTPSSVWRRPGMAAAPLRSSTSNGRAACWSASPTVPNVASSRSAKRGSPPQSLRRAIVLMKGPATPSSSSSWRPATWVVTRMSSCRAQRCSSAVKAARPKAKKVAPCRRAVASTACIVASGTIRPTMSPRRVGVAGTSRSSGTANAPRPASRPRQ